MSFEPVRLLSVLWEPEEGRTVPVGRLARRGHELLFEYDPSFLKRGLELSPFKLPLRPGVFVGDPRVFDGLMGVFDDSLPDGWGRLLMDRRAARAGLDPRQLGPLDRLSLVGARAMGALVYEPQVALEPPSVVSLREVEAETRAVLRGARGADLERLIALGGSPHGARPKALVQLSPAGEVISGSAVALAGCTAWLVKFRARDDGPHAGTLELAYTRMAQAAGLEVPEARLLGRTRGHPGYLALRRFDRDGKRKRHLLTATGLLHAPHTVPSLTYEGLLQATRRLTRDERAVAEQFRRACFNVLAHNRDDHARNFSFLMDVRGTWRLSPAYDLTFSSGPGGEHATLLGDGADPGTSDLKALGAAAEVKRPQPIIEAVREAVSRFSRFADEAGLPKKLAREVARKLRP